MPRSGHKSGPEGPIWVQNGATGANRAVTGPFMGLWDGGVMGGRVGVRGGGGREKNSAKSFFLPQISPKSPLILP